MNTLSKKWTRRAFISGAAALLLFGGFHFIEPAVTTKPAVAAKPAEEKLPTRSEYIRKIAREDSELAPRLKNNMEGLRAYLSVALGKLKHATPKDYHSIEKNISVWETPTPEQLLELTDVQLIKMYYLLKALSDPSFRKKIGKELEKDAEDIKSEHGGVFRLLNGGKGAIQIEIVPPTEEIIREDFRFSGRHPTNSDGKYHPIGIPYTLDIIGGFHFHARTISPNHSAFSGSDFTTAAIMLSTEFFLFSRPEKNKFNVDVGIVLVEKNGTTIKKKLDIDLGVYDH